MTDLIIKRTNRLTMSGGSSVKSESKPSNFALMMYFGGTAKVISVVDTVNTIVFESNSITVETDYDSLSTNSCIGTSIQIHGPPMVDDRTFLHSFTVFTVNSKKTYQYKTNNFTKNNRRFG